MLLFELDAGSRTPRWRQIVDRVTALVDDGTLRPGDALPSSRALASRLGVNRTTVVRAYEELWAGGVVTARGGSHTVVRARLRRQEAGVPPGGGGAIDWHAASAPGAREAFERVSRLRLQARGDAGPRPIDAAGLAPDPRLAPVDDLRRAVARVLREGGAALLDYGSPAGLPVLREAIARRMRTHAVAVRAEEVLVTGGSQHALDLVARLLLAPGATVIVESPTYSMAIPLFRLHGAEIVPVEMRADGLDLDALESRLAACRPAFVYTTPTFHNPTGITTAPAHRERLLALCQRHRVPLVEDGFEEELKYFGRAVLPVKSLDRDGTVIYLGTFSKVLFPGLRVGWIAADAACVARVATLNRACNLSTTTLAQAAIAALCASGRFEAHVRRAHAAYRRRMVALLRALRERMPAGVEWSEPAGGYTLLVRVPGTALGEDELIERIAAAGLLVAPGSWFHLAPPAVPCFRLSISGLDETAIATGVERLAAALSAAVRR